MTSSRPAQPSQRRSASRQSGGHRGASLRTVRVAPGPSTPNAAPPATGIRPSNPHQELTCSAIGLTLKVGLAFLAVVSLVRLGGAYQTRLERYGEISAVLNIQQAKLLKAQHRFDKLFAAGGEQQLIQEQDQWIAPNRLRVVWQQPEQAAQRPFPTVEQAPGTSGKPTARP